MTTKFGKRKFLIQWVGENTKLTSHLSLRNRATFLGRFQDSLAICIEDDIDEDSDYTSPRFVVHLHFPLFSKTYDS